MISPVAVNTELGLGLSEPRQRQFRKLEPSTGGRRDRRDAARAEVRRARAKAGCRWLSASPPACRSMLQDRLARLTKADAVLSQADTAARAGYEAARLPLRAGVGGSARAASDHTDRRGVNRQREGRSSALSPRSQSAIRCRSAGPDPPAGSGWRPRSCGARGGRSTRRSARPPTAAGSGRSRPTASASGG